MTDYYKILQISPDADEREIRAAYRKLAKQYHPDVGEGSSIERFRLIQDAYELLSDAEKRREYDRSRRPRPPGRQVPRYYSPSAHIDLRDVMKGRAVARPEPVMSSPARYGRARMFQRGGLNDPWRDSWEELFDWLFRF